MYHQYLATPDKFPKPWIHITADDDGITSLYFVDEKTEKETKNEHSKLCVKELKEYFNHKRTVFTVALNPQGTEFQKKCGNIFVGSLTGSDGAIKIWR